MHCVLNVSLTQEMSTCPTEAFCLQGQLQSPCEAESRAQEMRKGVRLGSDGSRVYSIGDPLGWHRGEVGAVPECGCLSRTWAEIRRKRNQRKTNHLGAGSAPKRLTIIDSTVRIADK